MHARKYTERKNWQIEKIFLVPLVPYVRHLTVVKIIIDGKYCSVPHSFSIYEKEIKYVNCIRLKYFIHLIGIK